MKKIKVFIGFDRPNRIPAYVLIDSILEHSSVPVEVVLLHKGTLNEVFKREKGPLDSTEFSVSRFLVPYLSNYEGWSVFLDNDMLVNSDIAELMEFMSGDFAVKCVKNNQKVTSDVKFLGEKQTKYNMKNWTSVMLFNNEKCKALTPEYVSQAHGLELHQFKWLDDMELIGDLPLNWNYLASTAYKEPLDETPKLIHYTSGGPFFVDTKDCEYAGEWLNVYNRMNDYLTQ